jgi:hypothetical protein
MIPARLAIAAPPLLLVAVAALQMSLALTAQLSPWKGGGFGMFASNDGLPFREVRVLISAPTRSEELTVPPSLLDAAARAATFPRTRTLEPLLMPLPIANAATRARSRPFASRCGGPRSHRRSRRRAHACAR